MSHCDGHRAVAVGVISDAWLQVAVASLDRYERTDARALEDANGARGMSPALASTQLASSAPIVLPGRAPRSSAASDSRFPLP